MKEKQTKHQLSLYKMAPTPLHFCLICANTNYARYFVDDYLSMQTPENKKEDY
ncbi:MAG: hypothetical protein IAX21_09660 [Candidatus Bathyarchaeota archaeon]|nr:MAG: hypothetical protein IAX21_09660 [Candidatus Bathyarchaeota archaeon]